MILIRLKSMLLSRRRPRRGPSKRLVNYSPKFAMRGVIGLWLVLRRRQKARRAAVLAERDRRKERQKEKVKAAVLANQVEEKIAVYRDHQPRNVPRELEKEVVRMARVKADLYVFCVDSQGTLPETAPNRGSDGSQQARKRALGSYAGAGAGYTEAQNYAILSEPEVIECSVLASSALDRKAVGIWDCGATMSAGAADLLQPVFDACEARYGQVPLDPAKVRFTFAGGEQSHAESVLQLPMSSLKGQALTVHPVPNPYTPILLGLDNLRKFGMVLDFAEDTAYSKTLGSYLPTVRLPGGHLGLRLPGAEDEDEDDEGLSPGPPPQAS